jgi:tRNA-splicing endonuclease subunit Sen15
MESPNIAQDPVANVTLTVVRNLEDQHDWTGLEIVSALSHRPLIRGLPPRRLYTHPDDQIASLNHERQTGERLFQEPELEWVLPVRLAENWTLARFAAVFDSIPKHGPRGKRVVLATVHNDSTVVYYLMHEGVVKPRQN